MLTLYQAEWCPHSHRVRQRLTELGLDFVARQVPAQPERRDSMRMATGLDEIPVLVLDSGGVIAGEAEILTELDRRFDERPDAAAHRRKAREEAGARSVAA
jgi:glutathione S-transferase